MNTNLSQFTGSVCITWSLHHQHLNMKRTCSEAFLCCLCNHYKEELHGELLLSIVDESLLLTSSSFQNRICLGPVLRSVANSLKAFPNDICYAYAQNTSMNWLIANSSKSAFHVLYLI